MPTAISRQRLLQLRLANQLIEVRDQPQPTVPDVVHRLLALQAQDFGQALWAIGLRAGGALRSDVLAALDRGDVVRSWPMRGTLHFVPPRDLRWMLNLTEKRMLVGAATRQRQLDLDQATLDRARETAGSILSGGRALGRHEFLAALNAAGITTDGQRGYHIIWYLAQTGTLCWGPARGTQQALVLLDEWVPEPQQPERHEALREFARRYFTGHGPATLRDFVWWSKLTVAEAKTGLAGAQEALAEVQYADTSFWLAREDLERPLPELEPMLETVQLLPAFDEYVIGYQHREPVLPPNYAGRIVPGNNGVFQPTVVVRGRVAGTWRMPSRSRPSLRVDLFEPLTDTAHHGVGAAAEAYERFSQG